MAKPIILKPEPSQIVHNKALELVNYFSESFPHAYIRIDVEYHSGSKYTIEKGRPGG